MKDMNEENEKKWEYIRLISQFNSNDMYGHILIKLLHMYDRPNTQEVTLEEAKEFYERLTKGQV